MVEVAPERTAATAAAALAARIGEGEAAMLAAAALVEAELYGQPRFGFDLLEELAGARAPQPASSAIPAILPALSSIDARTGFAPLVLAQTVLALTPAIRQHGLVAVFLRGIRGFGRMAPFLRPLADAGYFCLAAAQAPRFVAPEGGSAPVIGTNPIGFAAGRHDNRLVFDLATSGITMATVKAARSGNSAELPPGTAIDANGVPTTSPGDLAAALPRGRLGSLTGLMVEILAGIPGGARRDAKGRGVVFIALDPGRLGSGDWESDLAELRSAWVGAQGYWPQAHAVAPDAPLSAQTAARLTYWLDRLQTPQQKRRST